MTEMKRDGVLRSRHANLILEREMSSNIASGMHFLRVGPAPEHSKQCLLGLQVDGRCPISRPAAVLYS
jgi:hypothetical protein